jgi:hypothetical protein
MAILYGTQSNGETLPVLVDQFGNLLAKGIEGQPGEPGPPGPPGVGELPLDPYEGALLGWQDGQLAWVGGSIVLPAGTYGPYTYIMNEGRLEIPQDGSDLIYGQQLFMSDHLGNQVSVTRETDTIASVGPGGPPWNNRIFSNELVGSVPLQGGEPGAWNLFSNNVGSGTYVTTGSITWTPVGGYPFKNKIDIYVTSNNFQTTEVQCTYVLEDGTVGQIYVPQNAGWKTIYEGSGTLVSLQHYTYKRDMPWGAISIDGNILVDSSALDPSYLLTFPTDNNLDKFEVGDEVQDGVTITDINPAGPTITVDGGSWAGADGSHTGPSVDDGQTYLSKQLSGSGSVQVGTQGNIILRADNKEWVDEYYVTAPEQRIAARKVAANARKLSKK